MYRKDRQNEFYTTLAKKEGYPARSVYKLKEIDEKYKIIKEGNRVLDLGCAPGSWLLYISQKVGNKGKVIGVDIEEIKNRAPSFKGGGEGKEEDEVLFAYPKANIVFIKKNVLDLKRPEVDEAKASSPPSPAATGLVFKNKFEVVVSDLSSKTSGVKFLDAGKSLELAEKSFEIAKSVLLPGGNFICKIFESESSDEFFKKVKNCFDFAKRFRPKAVIKKSKEFYIIGRGFRGSQ